MRIIQVIDGALNCAYDFFEASDFLFEYIFPNGRDIAFIEELGETMPEIDDEFEAMWKRPVNKKKVNGVHGTLFYELLGKKKYYPNYMESDLDFVGRAFCLKDAGLEDGRCCR